jgi:MFS superfamily sulfate permease-like transporter
MQHDGRFQGDMDRNEVEMDLNKFMAMVEEIGQLKDKIRDLEDESTKNPHQKWIFLAQAVDSWRIFPRAFLSVYMYLLYFTTFWFMALESPSFEQSGLISIVVGAGAAWFGLYAGTSGSSKSFKGENDK